MTYKERQAVKEKYGSRCAYCGCELIGTWHIDEILPCRRNYKMVYNQTKGKWIRKFTGYMHPERLHIDNQMPSCASCNINKHSMSLEEFRYFISGFLKHLNVVSTQYKIAKRYNLVEETGKSVLFYFETLEDKITN